MARFSGRGIVPDQIAGSERRFFKKSGRCRSQRATADRANLAKRGHKASVKSCPRNAPENGINSSQVDGVDGVGTRKTVRRKNLDARGGPWCITVLILGRPKWKSRSYSRVKEALSMGRTLYSLGLALIVPALAAAQTTFPEVTNGRWKGVVVEDRWQHVE